MIDAPDPSPCSFCEEAYLDWLEKVRDKKGLRGLENIYALGRLSRVDGFGTRLGGQYGQG